MSGWVNEEVLAARRDEDLIGLLVGVSVILFMAACAAGALL